MADGAVYIPPVLAPVKDFVVNTSPAADVLDAVELRHVLTSKEKSSASPAVVAFGRLLSDGSDVAIKAFVVAVEDDKGGELGQESARLMYEQIVYAYLTRHVPGDLLDHFVRFVAAGYSIHDHVAASRRRALTQTRMRELLLGPSPDPRPDAALRTQLADDTLAAGKKNDGRAVGVALTVTTLTPGSRSLTSVLEGLGADLASRSMQSSAVDALRNLLAQALIALFVASRLGVEHHDMHEGNVLVAPVTVGAPPLAVALPSGLRLRVALDSGVVTLFDWDAASCVACGHNTGLDNFMCPRYGMCDGATERRDVFYLLSAFNDVFKNADHLNPVPDMVGGAAGLALMEMNEGYFCQGQVGVACRPYPPGEPRNVPDVLELLHHPFFDPLRM